MTCSYQQTADALCSTSTAFPLAELYGVENIVCQRTRYLNILHQLEKNVPDGRPFFISAPGRTELGGNHTDHNCGNILAAAVDLDCVGAVSPAISSDDQSKIILHSAQLDAPVIVDLRRLTPVEEERGSAAALIRGVAAAMNASGVCPKGFHACLDATCPSGVGLSTSAAFSVFIGAALAFSGRQFAFSAQELARMAQQAENDYFGKPCGLMDQMASAVGRIVFVDFSVQEEPKVNPIIADLEGFGYQPTIIDTGGSHTELTPEYAAVPEEMKKAAKAAGGRYGRDISSEQWWRKLPDIRCQAGDRAALRLLHFIEENKRVERMAQYLQEGQYDHYLNEVKISGYSSCTLLQNCSTSTTTTSQGILLALAVFPLICPAGIYRVHGGGFAGTVQAYIPQSEFAHFSQKVEYIFGEHSIHPLRIGRPGVCAITGHGLHLPGSQDQ